MDHDDLPWKFEVKEDNVLEVRSTVSNHSLCVYRKENPIVRDIRNAALIVDSVNSRTEKQEWLMQDAQYELRLLDEQAETLRELSDLKEGRQIIVPQSVDHAKAMLSVAQSYLESNNG